MFCPVRRPSKCIVGRDTRKPKTPFRVPLNAQFYTMREPSGTAKVEEITSTGLPLKGPEGIPRELPLSTAKGSMILHRQHVEAPYVISLGQVFGDGARPLDSMFSFFAFWEGGWGLRTWQTRSDPSGRSRTSRSSVSHMWVWVKNRVPNMESW